MLEEGSREHLGVSEKSPIHKDQHTESQQWTTGLLSSITLSPSKVKRPYRKPSSEKTPKSITYLRSILFNIDFNS